MNNLLLCEWVQFANTRVIIICDDQIRLGELNEQRLDQFCKVLVVLLGIEAVIQHMVGRVNKTGTMRIPVSIALQKLAGILVIDFDLISQRMDVGYPFL